MRVGFWNHIWGFREPLIASRAAEKNAQTAEQTADWKRPSRSDYVDVATHARTNAMHTDGAFRSWDARIGQPLTGDAERLQTIREAAADKDSAIVKALISGGYEAAVEVVKQKERERKQRSGACRGRGISKTSQVKHQTSFNPWGQRFPHEGWDSGLPIFAQ